MDNSHKNHRPVVLLGAVFAIQLILVGWCAYLEVRMNDVSGSSPTSISSRVSTLEVSSSSIVNTVDNVKSGLQVTFDAESVFAFIDVFAGITHRGYIAPNQTLELLPELFDSETTYGANTARNESLFWRFQSFSWGQMPAREYFLSDGLTLFCSHAPGTPNTHACTRLQRPSCTYMNMFKHFKPSGNGYTADDIDLTTVLLTLSYLGCVNTTSTSTPPPPPTPDPTNSTESNGTAT
jgi:hypothetical protein